MALEIDAESDGMEVTYYGSVPSFAIRSRDSMTVVMCNNHTSALASLLFELKNRPEDFKKFLAANHYEQLVVLQETLFG